LHGLEIRSTECGGMKMRMRIQCRTEARWKTHRPEACCFRCTRTAPTQPCLDGPQYGPRDPIEQCRIAVDEIAQAFEKGNHPLTHRHFGEYVLDEVRGRLGHAPRGAGRTHASALAGVGDQKVMPTPGAAGAGEAVRQNAAGQVPAQFPLDVCSDRHAWTERRGLRGRRDGRQPEKVANRGKNSGQFGVRRQQSLQ
jgi:hypothetical protein